MSSVFTVSAWKKPYSISRYTHIPCFKLLMKQLSTVLLEAHMWAQLLKSHWHLKAKVSLLFLGRCAFCIPASLTFSKVEVFHFFSLVSLSFPWWIFLDSMKTCHRLPPIWCKLLAVDISLQLLFFAGPPSIVMLLEEVVSTYLSPFHHFFPFSLQPTPARCCPQDFQIW